MDRPSFCKAWCVNDEKQRTGASFCARIPTGNPRRGPLFAPAGVYIGFRLCARPGGRLWLFFPAGGRAGGRSPQRWNFSSLAGGKPRLLVFRRGWSGAAALYCKCGCRIRDQFRPPAGEKRNAVPGALLCDRGLLLPGYRARARHVGGVDGRVGGPLWRGGIAGWRRRLFFLPLFFPAQSIQLPARARPTGDRMHRILLCDPAICACGL